MHLLLDILDQGAWNGGIVVDNTQFEKQGITFKGGIPVTDETIQERIGVKTRRAAPLDERIGVIALADLLKKESIDPSKIKLVIGATNVGDDKYDRGPQIRHPFELIREKCPHALVFDLYAGCPGFNVSVELIFMLSMAGMLEKGDLSIIVGAENIHRANAFESSDTASIIFGDDSVATALETKAIAELKGYYDKSETHIQLDNENFIDQMGAALLELAGSTKIDGIIINNQLGKIFYRVPALAARVQHAYVCRQYPDSKHIFGKFKDAFMFYNQNVNTFAFDIMSLENNPEIVDQIAAAYVKSGKYNCIAAIHLDSNLQMKLSLHSGDGFTFSRPNSGIVDTATRTHGCFGHYIQVAEKNNDVFGEMDGKGVFLYATRMAPVQIHKLLADNQMKIDDIDLLIEHQANFAIIPLTLEQLLSGSGKEKQKAIADFVTNNMVMNIHDRGNCSVVCMQRLPYDLKHGTLKEDVIQGFSINSNTEALKNANTILYDSVGAGMTRSSFIRKRH